MNPASENPKMRRQPKQKRSQERVDRILEAAVKVFDEVGFEGATMNAIAHCADTAIGSVYQFFPDKLAIFQALELRHLERVGAAWAKISNLNIIELPFEEFIKTMVAIYKEVFDEPTSRLLFIQYFTSKTMFQRIDDSLTQQGIDFQANLLKARNPALTQQQCNLIAEVCVQAANALIVVALRSSKPHREEIFEQIEQLLIAYLRPYDGEKSNDKVMISCPQCDSRNLSKNGFRHEKQRYICKDCGRQFLSRVK
ncbi:TetR family transcriptional regulator protein [Calothrix sp. NIES-4101]|nr:TetR family transcriptional regulator protein [Calothrix sp. NIES-4101]